MLSDREIRVHKETVGRIYVFNIKLDISIVCIVVKN